LSSAATAIAVATSRAPSLATLVVGDGAGRGGAFVFLTRGPGSGGSGRVRRGADVFVAPLALIAFDGRAGFASRFGARSWEE